ncbi:MAG TPA: hypothetical protein VFS19_05175 [Planctomycetota bacterium]|nr:hypothetical protein [Planctomycetota bacterium]
MAESPIPRADTFDHLKTETWGIAFKGIGMLAIAAGLFTSFVGFRINYVEYSGLLPGLSFLMPGVTILGIGYVLSAVATIGEFLLANRKLWIRAAHPESRIENPESSG